MALRACTMNVSTPAAAHRRDELAQKPVVVAIVDADAALDRDRHGVADRRAHRAHAARDQFRVRHQTRAKTAALHAVAGTADVEVDLVVPGRRAQLRGTREQLGVRTADLQRHRMFAGVELEQPCERRRARVAWAVSISVYSRTDGLNSRSRNRQ